MSEKPPREPQTPHEGERVPTPPISTEPVVYNPPEEVRVREEADLHDVHTSLEERREAAAAEKGAAADSTLANRLPSTAAPALESYDHANGHHSAGPITALAINPIKGIFGGVLWAWVKQIYKGIGTMAGKGGGGGHAKKDDHGGGHH